PRYPMAEIPAIKRRLMQEGVDVIDVGAGDADFPPPEAAVEALSCAARDPAMSRYAFQLGLPAFREAAAAYMLRRFGVRVDPYTQLHPLLGSKEGIAHLAMALLGSGRSEEHTSELQSRGHLVCRLLLEKKKQIRQPSK